eukprot:scaffold5186_cov100-Skeletonema_dohrnii-CCMP3373.AAC.9
MEDVWVHTIEHNALNPASSSPCGLEVVAPLCSFFFCCVVINQCTHRSLRGFLLALLDEWKDEFNPQECGIYVDAKIHFNVSCRRAAVRWTR